MTETELKQIEDRLDRATPGPWRWDRSLGIETLSEVDGWGDHDVVANLATHHRSSGEFIANAREDVRLLLEEIRRLQATIAKAG